MPTGINYLAVLVAGVVVFLLGGLLATPNLVSGACVGAMLWLIAGATSYGTSLFSFKSRALWTIDTGYNLVSMVIAGAWH